MKKIVLFYAKFGGGHLSAANALKQYLEANYSNEYEVEIIDFFAVDHRYGYDQYGYNSHNDNDDQITCQCGSARCNQLRHRLRITSSYNRLRVVYSDD